MVKPPGILVILINDNGCSHELTEDVNKNGLLKLKVIIGVESSWCSVMC